MAEDTDNGTNGGGPRQISVSRDALRADLTELELRLKSYIAIELEKKAAASAVEVLQNQIEKKAAAAVVNDLQTQFTNLKRAIDAGEFSRGQKLTIEEMIDAEAIKKSAASWTWKERGIMFVGAVVAITSLGFTAVYTIHSLNSVSVQLNPGTTTTQVHHP